MDDNLREIGIGDLAMPKHMRRVRAAFYGRAQAYREALARRGRGALVEALTRNIYGGSPNPGNRRLAAYVREAAHDLKALDEVGFAAAAVRFPEPSAITT